MISNVSHESVSRLVADRGMCLDTASDKAFENNGCTLRSFVARQRIASVNHLNALFNCVQYDAVIQYLFQTAAAMRMRMNDRGAPSSDLGLRDPDPPNLYAAASKNARGRR
jgi:hypothetical protein